MSPVRGWRWAVLFVVVIASVQPALAATTARNANTVFARQKFAGPVAPLRASAPGYWMANSAGGVFSFGAAQFAGSIGSRHLAAPIVGMLATPTGRGYWLASADGGVFAFGDAPFLGNAVVRPPGAAPIVAIIGTPSGGGYWLVASDGFVYTLGDATYWGSPPRSALHAPIVDAAASPSGEGYYLVAADGSVYPEGDAWGLGDAANVHLAAPIVSITVAPGGRGYWLIGGDGGVLAYGTARFFGSMGGRPLSAPVAGLTPTADGGGYWLLGSDGGVFSFGDAPYLGGAVGNGHMLDMRAVPAAHGTAVATFYYPWYATPAHDGQWRHWDEGGHTPPDDIGSDYYPLRGAYSSHDPVVVDSQMGDLQASGINEAIVSWWGQGSYEDQALPALFGAAAHHGITIGIQLEPYPGRSPASVTSDFAYLHRLGITDVWVYFADEIPPNVWAGINDQYPDMRTWAESGNVGFMKSGGIAPWALAGHFTGIYIYDAINFEARDDTAFCGWARTYSLLCAPVAAPGFIAVRATGAHYGRSRENGSTYDHRWMGVVGSRPDVVAITSYNEWHEGSQIEPVALKCLSSTFCYFNYEGAFGMQGAPSAYAYLVRTTYWSSLLRVTNP
jgi:hypothetical protein